MRTLTAAAQLAAAKRDAYPIFLLQIDFTDPVAFTLRISDATRIELGQEWLPLVQSWGSIDERLNPMDAGSAPATFDLTLFNAKPVASRSRVSDLIRSPKNTGTSYTFEGAKATLYRLDAGLALGNEQPLGIFYLEEPTEIDDQLLRIRMTDQSLLLENKADLVSITTDIFPRATFGAGPVGPAALGKTIPLAIGLLNGNLDYVMALPIALCPFTTLTADVASLATTLPVQDTSQFADPPPNVSIIMTAPTAAENVTAKTPTSFTVGAIANAHSAGAAIWQNFITSYFVVAENKGPHRVRAVTNILVNDVDASSLAPGINLDNTTIIPGRSFVTIGFTTVPIGPPFDTKRFEVKCKVVGLQDDTVGSLTGQGLALLENPADVTKLVMRQVYGIPPEAFGDWTIARARLAAAGYKWAGLIGADGPLRFSDFRRTVEEQSRCRLFVEGGVWKLVYLDDEPIPVAVLDWNRDVWEQLPARASRTERTRVFDIVKVTSQKDYSVASVGTYLYSKRVGPNTGNDTTLALPWVRDQRTADTIATAWQRFWSRQRWQVELIGWQNLLALDKADCVTLDNHPVLTGQGAGNVIFRIAGKRYQLDAPNPSEIRLLAVEANL